MPTRHPPPTPAVRHAHIRSNHWPHKGKRDLQQNAADVHDDLAAWKRAQALLEEPIERQNASKDKGHHTASPCHVKNPVGRFGGLFVPTNTAIS